MLALTDVLWIIFALSFISCLICGIGKRVKPALISLAIWFVCLPTAIILVNRNLDLSVRIFPPLAVKNGALTGSLFDMLPSLFVVVMPSFIIFLVWKRRKAKKV